MKIYNLQQLFKNGGQGSGNFRHQGRPGLVGGSGIGSGDKSQVIAILRNIRANPKMRRIAAGFMADGDIDDVANLTGLVSDIVGYQFSGEERDPILNSFYSDYEKAISSQGYEDMEDDGMSEGRSQWEKYYYGRIVGGHSAGEAFAQEALRDYIGEGYTPPFETVQQPAFQVTPKTEMKHDFISTLSEEDRNKVYGSSLYKSLIKDRRFDEAYGEKTARKVLGLK